MPPGSRKSAVFAAMTAPLLAAEQALAEHAAPLIVEAELARRTAQRDAERHANGAANASSPEARTEALGMAADAALAAERMTVPVRPRLVADDVTAEAAGSLLAEQDGRLAVLSAEGGIFTTIAGRYSTAPNLEVFLKSHAGDLLRVDRVGRAAEHIADPALTLGLAVQPEVLRDIARMPGFRGRGLLARILYAVPPNTVGHRRVGAPAVPEAVEGAYHETLCALALSLADLQKPAALALSTEADELMLRLEAELEPRLADDAELGYLADWASKLNGAIGRLAGLLHLAENLRDGWVHAIGTDTVEDAARLGHYYLAHALAVFDLMHADPVVDGAHTILEWITRTGTQRFTRRQLFTAISRARFRKAIDLDQPLEQLEQHGYLRRAPTPPPTGGRPAAQPFDVNPHTFDDQPQQPQKPQKGVVRLLRRASGRPDCRRAADAPTDRSTPRARKITWYESVIRIETKRVVRARGPRDDDRPQHHRGLPGAAGVCPRAGGAVRAADGPVPAPGSDLRRAVLGRVAVVGLAGSGRQGRHWDRPGGQGARRRRLLRDPVQVLRP